jgi:divalent metal cation (Fe/Co/Zn/Cd) transporter
MMGDWRLGRVKELKFYWKAMLVAFFTAVFSVVAIVGIAYLVGDHPDLTFVGYLVGSVVALAVFAEGVDHLSEKADAITEAIKSVEASVERTRP